MVSLIKAVIILVAILVFIYAARLAVQGDLESEIITRDYITAKSALLSQIDLFLEKM